MLKQTDNLVGFIGLGHAGSKLAASLLRNGYQLVVNDVDPGAVTVMVEKGAQAASSPRELSRECDIVITCLPSPQVSADVLERPDGVLAGLGAVKIWLEMSSTDEDEMKRLGALVEAKGAFTLDCPISGGCHRADTGNISIFAGGSREAFEAVLPLLTTMGRRVIHTGPLGTASVMKVVTNYLAGIQLIASGEAFMVAKKSGIDLGVAYETIRISSGNSFVHETEGQVILNGSYNIGFTMDLELKDLTLFNNLGKKHNIPMELSPLAVKIIEDGLSKYGPRVWSSMVVRRLEDACGEALRATGFPDELVDDEPEEPGYEVKVS